MTLRWWGDQTNKSKKYSPVSVRVKKKKIKKEGRNKGEGRQWNNIPYSTDMG